MITFNIFVCVLAFAYIAITFCTGPFFRFKPGVSFAGCASILYVIALGIEKLWSLI